MDVVAGEGPGGACRTNTQGVRALWGQGGEGLGVGWGRAWGGGQGHCGRGPAVPVEPNTRGVRGVVGAGRGGARSLVGWVGPGHGERDPGAGGGATAMVEWAWTSQTLDLKRSSRKRPTLHANGTGSAQGYFIIGKCGNSTLGVVPQTFWCIFWQKMHGHLVLSLGRDREKKAKI